MWFCCNCGDGPYNYSVAPSCQNCGHAACAGCNGEKHNNHSYSNATINSISAATATGSFSPTEKSFGSMDLSYPGTSLMATHGHHHGDGGHGYGHDAPVDGQEAYRWICCNCGGDNNCKHDVGCSSCSNHWRQACCVVYAVKQ